MPTKKCLENIAKLGPDAHYCTDPADTCQQAAAYIHAVCNCLPPFDFPGVCPYTSDSPIPAYNGKELCYCCCSDYVTVAVGDNQLRGMQELVPGDMVLTASVDPATQNLLWETRPIAFSQGTGNLTEQSSAVVVLFHPDGHNEQSLVVNRNQLFYMPDGTLRRADTLVPGLDMVVTFDGKRAPVTGLSTSTSQGTHHIATSQEPATSVDNHLISIKGVVCGDYALQISMVGRNTDDEKVRPTFGTREYLERHSGYLTIDSLGVRTAEYQAVPVLTESLLGLIGESATNDPLPTAVQLFFTNQQSLDILNNPDAVRHYPPTDTVVKMANNLLKTCADAYPDITFMLDTASSINASMNSYAVLLNNQKYVVITSGLISLDAIKPESLAVIIAHGIAYINSGSATSPGDFSCVGKADYDAVGTVCSKVWYSYYNQLIPSALSQLEDIFQLIVPASDRQGLPGDTCMNISTDCRLQAMNTAFMSLPLPACAGGAS